jgi:ABC-type nickel/cobalt efflux system permease component RcnA
VNSASALVLAAAGVGFGHAVLPDHWAPLAVLGRTRGEPLARTVRRSLAAAGTHVALSILLGALLIAVGLRFRDAVVHDEDLVVGGLLTATGAVLLALELAGRGHGHAHAAPYARPQPHPEARPHARPHSHSHPHTHAHPAATPAAGPLRSALAVAVPFGAAASPDLTILPVFLAASTFGGAVAVGSLLVFALVTVGTIVGLTVAASLGTARLTAPWIERRANLLTAATLLLFGTIIACGLL